MVGQSESLPIRMPTTGLLICIVIGKKLSGWFGRTRKDVIQVRGIVKENEFRAAPENRRGGRDCPEHLVNGIHILDTG